MINTYLIILNYNILIMAATLTEGGLINHSLGISAGGLKTCGYNDGSKILQYYNSSRRYKTNIRTIPNDEYTLDSLLKYRPVFYSGLEQQNEHNNKYIGFIAEELHELGLNEVVIYSEPCNILSRIDSIDYSKITVHIIKAFQEQNVIIQNQQATIQDLQSQVTSILKLLSDKGIA